MTATKMITMSAPATAPPIKPPDVFFFFLEGGAIEFPGWPSTMLSVGLAAAGTELGMAEDGSGVVAIFWVAEAGTLR